jgi:hypothetical protein
MIEPPPASAGQEKPPSMDMLVFFACMLVPVFVAWLAAVFTSMGSFSLEDVQLLQQVFSKWQACYQHIMSRIARDMNGTEATVLLVLAQIGVVALARYAYRGIRWLKQKRQRSLPIHNRLLFKLDNLRRFLWKSLIKFTITKARVSSRKRPISAEHIFQNEERHDFDAQDNPTSEAYYHHILCTYGSWIAILNPTSIVDSYTSAQDANNDLLRRRDWIEHFCQELIIIALAPHRKELRRYQRRVEKQKVLQTVSRQNQYDKDAAAVANADISSAFFASSSDALHLLFIGQEEDDSDYICSLQERLKSFRDTKIHEFVVTCKACGMSNIPNFCFDIEILIGSADVAPGSEKSGQSHLEQKLSSRLGRMTLDGGLGLFVICPPKCSSQTGNSSQQHNSQLEYPQLVTNLLHAAVLPHMMFRNSGAIVHLNDESSAIDASYSAAFNEGKSPIETRSRQALLGPILYHSTQAYLHQLIRSMFYEYHVHGIDCLTMLLTKPTRCRNWFGTNTKAVSTTKISKKFLHEMLIILGKEGEL